jgi:hypothetical protein
MAVPSLQPLWGPDSGRSAAARCDSNSIAFSNSFRVGPTALTRFLTCCRHSFSKLRRSVTVLQYGGADRITSLVMFRAITKGDSGSAAPHGKGTLTGLWNRRAPQKQEAATQEPIGLITREEPEALRQQVDAVQDPAVQFDPAPASEQRSAAVAPAEEEKKRKRCRPMGGGYTDEQRAELEACFARNENASKGEKMALALKLGLEVDQVGGRSRTGRAFARACGLQVDSLLRSFEK